MLRRLVHQKLALRFYSANVMSLKRPYDIFSSTPPKPPWILSSPSLAVNHSPPSSNYEWQEVCATGTQSISKAPLLRIEKALRRAYRQKIKWPINEAHLSTIPAEQYLKPFLQPIISLFGLYAPCAVPAPVHCITIDYGHSIRGVTFRSNPVDISVFIPVVISLPDMFDDRGQPCPQTLFALSQAIEHNKFVRTIIVTDFKNIAVFKPPSKDSRKALFERIDTSQPLLALRALTVAHIREDITGWAFVFEPGDAEGDDNLLLPEGPPVDPRQPLLDDQEVFTSHHRVSDFDGVSLVRDRSRALQFFRWRRYVQEHCTKLAAGPRDTVAATTRDTHVPPPPPPLYPLDLSELPSETLTHLNAIQRESPLASAGIAEAFTQSKSFTIEIDNVISERSKQSICSIFRCHITSIDDVPVTSSPTLCLKLFDDRFQQAGGLEEDDSDLEDRAGDYLKQIIDADLYVLDEASAYTKLQPVQGSIVPWFYGAHKFTFANGMYLYGILLEHIEGRSLLDIDFVKGLSTNKQIAAIQSCREGVRVLDLADIAQRDWHGGQVLLHRNPANDLDYVVLIDFASVTQTHSIEEPNPIDNYSEALTVLRCAGFNRDLVWQHFGRPDDWDAANFTLIANKGQEVKSVRAREMFPWISSPRLYSEV